MQFSAQPSQSMLQTVCQTLLSSSAKDPILLSGPRAAISRHSYLDGTRETYTQWSAPCQWSYHCLFPTPRTAWQLTICSSAATTRSIISVTVQSMGSCPCRFVCLATRQSKERLFPSSRSLSESASNPAYRCYISRLRMSSVTLLMASLSALPSVLVCSPAQAGGGSHMSPKQMHRTPFN